MFKHSVIALALSSLLVGCSLDGDDGALDRKDHKVVPAPMAAMVKMAAMVPTVKMVRTVWMVKMPTAG